jgi:dolichol kinase
MLYDLASTVVLFAVALGWSKVPEKIAQHYSVEVSRKAQHIGMGLVYMACWTLYNTPLHNYHYSRWFAASVPFAFTIKMVAVGIGAVRDEEVVRALSRKGDRSELLYGPLLYGIAFVVASVVFWFDSLHAIVALMMLCVGDGSAALLGSFAMRKQSAGARNTTRHVPARPWYAMPLPWNTDKSVVGLVAFIVLSTVASVAYIRVFEHYGCFNTAAAAAVDRQHAIAWSPYRPLSAWHVAVVAIVSGLVESATSSIYDNGVVFAVGVVMVELVSRLLL